MKKLFILFGLLLACENNIANHPLSLQDQLLLANKRACAAKGEVEIDASKALNEDCTTLTARLNRLALSDQDCKAYFGDKPVQVQDVCNQP